MNNTNKSPFSQAFYEALVENAPELIAVIGTDGTITYQSGSTERILGYGPGALIGRNVSELIHPDDFSEVNTAIQKIAVDPDALETVELRFLHGNGSWSMLRATGRKLPASSGVDGIVVNAQDVTEQRAANTALSVSEARYRELTEATSDWIWAVDENLIFTYSNQEIENILGYTPDEMLGRRPFDFMSPEEAKRVREATRPAVSSQSAFENLEVVQLHKDGREIDLEISGVPIIEKDGAFRGYRGIARDITARKVTEEKLHHTNRLLRILRACNSALIHEIDEDKLLASICQLIVMEGELISLNGTYPLAMVAFVRDDAEKSFEIVTIDGPGAGFAEDLKRAWGDATAEQGPIERALATGAPVIIRSIENEVAFVPWAERAAEYGVASMGAFPLSDGQRTFGVIVVFADKAQAFDHDEVSLLTELANDVVYGITTIRDRVRRVASETRELEFEHRTERAMMQTIEAISRAAEMRDPYTAGHQRGVARLAEAIAREMGLPKTQCIGIQVAGTLHDIGKLQVPMDILSKPTVLNEAEMTLVRMHAEYGYHILQNIEFPWPIAEMVRQHHERLDGSGYPQGLRGDQMQCGARILAVADTVEAMASHRPYRPTHGTDGALLHLMQERGKLFDADAVDACIKLFKEKGFTFEPR